MLDSLCNAMGCLVIISAVYVIISMIYLELVDLIKNNKSKKRLNKK